MSEPTPAARALAAVLVRRWAGLVFDPTCRENESLVFDLRHFYNQAYDKGAAEARREEREACAALADLWAGANIAAAIRARPGATA